MVVMTGTGGSHKSENRPTLVRSNIKEPLSWYQSTWVLVHPRRQGTVGEKALRAGPPVVKNGFCLSFVSSPFLISSQISLSKTRAIGP
jgi:hypothetical protein